jgi:hypothetical protein
LPIWSRSNLINTHRTQHILHLPAVFVSYQSIRCVFIKLSKI